MFESKQPISDEKMLQTLYVMSIYAVLFHKKFRKDVETIGSGIDPNNMCIENKTGHGDLHTTIWRLVNIKSSYSDLGVGNNFLEQLKLKYTNNKICQIKVMCSNMYHYLTRLYYQITPRQYKLKVVISNYVDELIDEFINSPWNKRLFKCPMLRQEVTFSNSSFDLLLWGSCFFVIFWMNLKCCEQMIIIIINYHPTTICYQLVK